ncbi:MAG TPA: hypothetical protein GX515_04305 [Firmicutes bacterium]|nr:hypothetical protein [Bacillota bacterium]
MTNRLTKHQVSGVKKDLEQKRNRTKMKEQLKARRQEKRARRHESGRRDRETIELIEEFLDDFGEGFEGDGDGEAESDD